jgi:hypothetical protein
LAADRTLRADPRRVFTGASIDNGIDENLQFGNMSGKQSMEVEKQSNLDWVLVGKEMDDLERMCNNADSEKLLAVITTLHHQTESAHIQYGRRYDNIIANLSTRRSTMGI